MRVDKALLTRLLIKLAGRLDRELCLKHTAFHMLSAFVRGIPIDLNASQLFSHLLRCIQLEEKLNDSLKIIRQVAVRTLIAAGSLEIVRAEVTRLAHIFEEKLVGLEVRLRVFALAHRSKDIPSLLVLVELEQLLDLLIVVCLLLCRLRGRCSFSIE